MFVINFDAYWQWAQADERVLGFCAWHWTDHGEVGKPDRGTAIIDMSATE